jgi:DNA polymerase-3 subunit epsilon/ATP-dependent DNA helicase DinG
LAPRYVAIDTETTGLDPEQDEIIEVAAIAFDLDGTLAEYNTLVRPFRLPPYRIERLTGIEGGLLEAAPRFSSIAYDLGEFIGDSPVVGQSVGFDVTFLGQAGVIATGPAYDTFDMAQLLLPGLGDYSLRGIADALGIDFPVRHRARADAEAARCVFLALRRRMAELPGWLLHELERLASAGGWSLAALLRELVAALPRGVDEAVGLTADVLAPPVEIPKAMNGAIEAGSLDVAETLRLLRGARELTEFFPEFETRAEQETMAAAVTNALNEGRHLIAEAGTGTGKSLAYLLPAALHALRRRQRVVVSTDTIGLQEQLIEKDLPVVQALIGGVEAEELRIASLKGRRNYLCLQRWTGARHQPPSSKEEAMLRARLLVWLRQTQTGDRAELNLHSSLDGVWAKFAAENVACLQVGCPFVRQGTCFLQRAKRRAESAHVLVVNHALLLSDMATGGHVLPPYSHLIIDEAHNLEDEATARFAFHASEADVSEFLDRIGRRGGDRSGIVGALGDAMRGSGEILVPGAYLASLGSALLASANKIRGRVSEPFRLLNRVLREYALDEREGDGSRLLVTRAIRVQSIWSDLEIAAENLDNAFVDLTNLIDDLRSLLEANDQGLLDQDGLLAEVTDLLQVGLGLREGLRRALLEGDASTICWLERSRQTGEVSVSTAPLAVADLLRHDLFGSKETVVLTSATLSAEGRFDYLRERVGLDDADELLLGSPFDFQSSTLIACPTDLPEPNEPDFVAAVSELLIEACRASGGRALVLFTAYGALNAVYDNIKGALEAEGILVLGHGTDGSPRQMLAALRENPRTVLLGTASFWEGVDVAGEALSLLVIVRLPFAVPTDPIYQARSALYDEPFDQYALPQAVLRFRQGFGRLIRTKTDRGVLLMLDRRIRARKYGDAFLRSLPRCTLRDLASREIPAAVADWLE